ncbi:platelet-activating factor acetylhydrolase isoform II [Kribbella amoyensis]|uniref:Platelet-activating factor acetylhydrolase isoform II n=1 Tax=Kribbella amoyensis TaxID=996641 RepID=A0A561BW69_9ACTN|nr:platelet-activating factor acetylhydrolase isoform II [Kribbella amoyensis]
MALLVLVVLFAGAGYLGWVGIQRSQPLDLPAPTGAYAVGRTTYDWTDTARKDPFSPEAGTPRKLSVWIWYPVSPSTTGPRVPYAPGPWDGLHLKGPAGLLQGSFDTFRDRALDDAPVAPSRFPVVVLQPGMGFSAPQYAALAEDLASHGYLVAGFTPTYSANLTVLDGQTVGSTEQAKPDDLDEHGDRIVQVWAADARFVATTLAALDEGPLEGRVNPATKVSYVGHSFGGAASLEACRLDPRCGAAIDLDGTQYGEVVKTGLKAPFLLVGSEDSCITGSCGQQAKDDTADLERARSLIKASTAAKWCATVDGARHFNFTDYGAYYLAWPLRAALPLGDIDPERALTIQNGYAVTFLDHAIRGTAAPGAPTC